MSNLPNDYICLFYLQVSWGGGGVTNKETSKGWVCDNFPRQFLFFLGAIHEKHIFKYLKNLTVTFCIIWCNDVYVYVYSSLWHFWWKLIDRIFLFRFLKPRWSSWHSPFLQFPLFCTWLSQNRIFRYARYFIFIQQQHSQVY
jgi:hypothetical protein